VAERAYADGEVIFRQGDPPGPVYLVEQGTVRIVKIGKTGYSLLGELGRGDIFGEMALIDDSPRMATARAVGDVVCSETDPIQMQRKLALLGPEPLAFYGQMIGYIRAAMPYEDRTLDMKAVGDTRADRAARVLLERLPSVMETIQHPPPMIVTLFEMFAEYIQKRLPPR
jgi:hypothetical protein